MHPDQNAPAEKCEQASRERHADERMDPEMFAYSLIRHLLDEHGEDEAEPYLVRVVEEVVELEPAVRQRLSDLLIAELKEELAKFVPENSRTIIALIEQVEEEWRRNG